MKQSGDQPSFTAHNPTSIHPPLGGYSHGLEIPAGARLLFISGQVGVRADGMCPHDCSGQLEVAWSNVDAVLESAAMERRKVVKVVCYLKDEMYAEDYARSSRAYFGGHRPAMSAAIVRRLWAPEWLFELELVAAAVDG